MDELDVDRATAVRVRKLIHATLHPSSVPGEQYYHAAYSWPERVMEALNRLLDGHGVEAVWSEKHSYVEPVFAYVNMGDPYIATIVYSYLTEPFWLGGYGDMVETLERRGYEL